MINDVEFDDFVFQQPQAPARASLGWLGTRQGNQFGFLLAVKNPRHRRHRALLATQHRLEAFLHRCAGLFPFRISASSCSRSSALNRTTYLFTEISFAAMIASVVPTVDESESSNPFNLVEAGD